MWRFGSGYGIVLHEAGGTLSIVSLRPFLGPVYLEGLFTGTWQMTIACRRYLDVV